VPVHRSRSDALFHRHHEGVGQAFKKKLAKAGVTNTCQLLTKASTPKGRKELAAADDIADGLILKWANLCDLTRIKGVAGEFAELLEAAGVDTVKELKTSKADHLHAKLVAVNAEKKLVRQTPTLKPATGCVAQAGELPAMMTSWMMPPDARSA
jgi:predicted flap endonuclease-1-like 5' DNA nuclease